jgi:uncharacterized membrane protein
MRPTVPALILTATLLTACGQREPSAVESNSSAPAASVSSEPSGNVGEPQSPSAPAVEKEAACLTQDGQKIAPVQLRAIGTEPFWNARIEGRCVTYSTPDDQGGTRIWTKFAGNGDEGTWSGALDGRQFELRTRPKPGCSDGMSDNRYPLAVTLRVGGETRQGCAAPV